MYDIRFDARKRILRLRLEGFWTPVTLARFMADLKAEATKVRASHGGFATLSDSRDFPVQSPEVAGGFAALMQGGGAGQAGPTAIVVASVLNKIQAERALNTPSVKVFLALEDAQRWLDAEWCDAIDKTAPL